MPTSAFKKKLHLCPPRPDSATTVETRASRKRDADQPCDPLSIERGVRQLLADKVSGNLAGVWLLVAEHLRLGTWDLLCHWTGRPPQNVEPRLALQLVHEAAVCTRGIRANRTLHGRGGFELANGLPFVASDRAIHELLAPCSIADSMELQVGLGKIRLASGDFQGKLLAIDPHRVQSHSKRRMRPRSEKSGRRRPVKMAQTFWVLDADTCQPICFTTGTAARSVVDATPELIDLAERILNPHEGQALVLADSEHFAGELIADLHRRSSFDLLTPLPHQPAHRRRWQALSEEQFTRHWAGYATAKVPYQMKSRSDGPFWEFVQRTGERPEDWFFKGFLSTSDREEVYSLTGEFPSRWHIEEFFNANQALGWNRAGTMNLNIRYAQMTMALIAQAALCGLRRRLGEPYAKWDATHMAKDLLFRLEGDVRVDDKTVLVTYYNAPQQLVAHYQHLPVIFAKDQIDPRIPWLYNYKLDFRFR